MRSAEFGRRKLIVPHSASQSCFIGKVELAELSCDIKKSWALFEKYVIHRPGVQKKKA
jgi:hypothetical protein